MTDTQHADKSGTARWQPGRADRPGRGWLVWRRLPWWLELATIAAAYVIYEASRALSAPEKGPAVAHANEILNAELWAHLDPEVTLNRLLNRSDVLSDAAGYYYSTCHFVITPLVLIFLWWRRPQLYPRLRSALVVATAAGLLVYVTWPVAPPRFTTHGVTDTLVHQHIMGMSDPHGVAGLINQYAAMPSLHVGWALWCAAAMTAAFHSRWRHLAWVYPALTTFVVMATGNHFLLDAVGGAMLVLAALAVTRPPAGVPGRIGGREASAAVGPPWVAASRRPARERR